jgi:hypothetical protein
MPYITGYGYLNSTAYKPGSIQKVVMKKR